MAKDRARDDRRSVGSFQKMMGALGKAAGGWERGTHYGAPVSEKINEETGEIKGVILGKGHVYHSGSNEPISHPKPPKNLPTTAYEKYE